MIGMEKNSFAEWYAGIPSLENLPDQRPIFGASNDDLPSERDRVESSCLGSTLLFYGKTWIHRSFPPCTGRQIHQFS